ncbi:hypothetical protein [Streptomyces sp. PKU-EA00015]|uniref:hypothetical protein n=1 Tax=Streptomyces sp. PKU-EA00015 TaxID=2748326 RepID=UPI00210AACA2|nr:hypothetical protein [Streptomyces sp. PKU-EA00015]
MATDQNLITARPAGSLPLVFGAGAAIGVLGGMIGLGGAEFRLPLLIGLFGFAALSAVILNKAMSLVVVLIALPARLAAVPAAEVAARWPVAVNLLAGRPQRHGRHVLRRARRGRGSSTTTCSPSPSR